MAENKANLAIMLGHAARQINEGKHSGAEIICREVLQQSPKDSSAWHYLALIEQKKGSIKRALEHIDQAITFGGFQSSYCMCKGNLLQDLGRLDEAETCFREVIKLGGPKPAQAYNNLGIVLRDQSKNEAAIEAFSRAVALDQRYVRAYNNLGIALQTADRLDEASACYFRAIEIDPDYVMAKYNLAVLCLAMGNRKEAENWYRNVLSINPNHVSACLGYGRILLDQRNFNAAENICLQAVKVDPNSFDAINMLAQVWATQGYIDKALMAYKKGLEIAPINLKSNFGLNLSLPQVYRDRSALEQARERYKNGLRVLHENMPALAQNQAEKIMADIQWNNFNLAYQGFDDKMLQAEYSRFVEEMLEISAPGYMRSKQQQDCGGRRIRIGFLGSYFYECTVGAYFKSWATMLDRDIFEVFVYYTHFDRDKVTEQVESTSDHFKQIPISLLRIADEVLNDELDILVFPEIGMNGKTNVLSSMRLAPVQCMGWGHPETSGHKNIDYYFSCSLMEPENAQNHYTEKLLLLPGIGTHYQMPILPLSVKRSDLALPEEMTLYLCPQSLFKILPDNDELFLKILKGDENAVLVFFSGRHEAVTNAFIERLVRQFDNAEMNTVGRVKILPHLNHDDYLRVNMVCDVMLDTLSWSGGNTSLDALSCGLPMVTLPGEMMRGRQSYGMLKAMGIDELIACDADDYVRIALKLGKNPDYRKKVSSQILANAGKIFSDDEPVREFQRALLGLVGRV